MNAQSWSYLSPVTRQLSQRPDCLSSSFKWMPGTAWYSAPDSILDPGVLNLSFTLESPGNLNEKEPPLAPTPKWIKSLKGWSMASRSVQAPQMIITYSQCWASQMQAVTFSRSERKDYVSASPSTWFDICSLTANTAKLEMDFKSQKAVLPYLESDLVNRCVFHQYFRTW